METAPALRQHIQDAIARGAQRKDLRVLLLKAGWPDDVVEQYLGEAPSSGAPALVRLRGVLKRFGDNVVLNNISMDIPPGELFGIIGLSGVGKTTLLNTLVGFIVPDAGDVLLQLPDGSEVSIAKRQDLVKTMFGFAAQIPSFYGKLSVRENIEHFAALYNVPPAKRIAQCDKLLRLVGLERAQHTLAQNLSGGMQKRLDIACALVHEPSILILDEPTADLDQIIRDQIWDLLQQIHRQGTTVIVASHVVSEIEQFCSTIAIMRDQRITEIGSTQQLRDIYSQHYEIFLRTKSQSYGKLKSLCSRSASLFLNPKEKDGMFVVQTPQPRNALQQLLKALAQGKETVLHVHVDRPSIAEVFESLIKNESHPLH